MGGTLAAETVRLSVPTRVKPPMWRLSNWLPRLPANGAEMCQLGWRGTAPRRKGRKRCGLT